MPDTPNTPPPHPERTWLIALALAAVFAVLLAVQVQRGDDDQHRRDDIVRHQVDQLLEDDR